MSKIRNFFRDAVKKLKIDSNGYERRYRPESPSAGTDGYAHTHRVVAEQKVGGKIYEGRVVHHRDDNKLNNDPGNLQVMPKKRHDKLHGLRFKKKK
jgi:hypothetical protein